MPDAAGRGPVPDVSPARPGREDQFVLAVDLGTGGPKVGLVSLTGAIACKEHLPVDTDRTSDGGATQDAEQWWQLICSATRRAVGSGVVPVSQIVAVSCTGQWASTVPVDADGHPVGHCLMWLDTRGADRARHAVGGRVGGYSARALARWLRHSGGAPSTSGADPIGHMLYLEHELGHVARAARWYLEPVDYLTMRFTGVAAASPASMAGAWLTDNRHPDRLEYDPVLIRSSGVPIGKLPPLLATGSAVGTVRPAVAAELGLGPGVTVLAGTPDLHSAAAGGRSRGGLPGPPGHLHHQLGELSLPREEDRSDPPDRHRPGHLRRPQSGGQQPGVGGRRPRMAPEPPTPRRRRAPLLRRDDRHRGSGRTWQRRGHLHAMAGR